MHQTPRPPARVGGGKPRPSSRAYEGREDEPDAVAESRSALEPMLSEAFVGRLFFSSCTSALTSTSSCSELSPFLKFLSACPRLLPSCGSFEGPKKSKASASTTMISPIPSLIASSGASRRATRIRRRHGSVLPTPSGKPCSRSYQALGGSFVEHAAASELLPGVWLTGEVPRRTSERPIYTRTSTMRDRVRISKRRDCSSDVMSISGRPSRSLSSASLAKSATATAIRLAKLGARFARPFEAVGTKVVRTAGPDPEHERLRRALCRHSPA